MPALLTAKILRVAALCAALVPLQACGPCSQNAEPGPTRSGRTVWKPPAPVNVVLIVIDTLRGDVCPDLAGRYDTPHIDRLAREGFVFPRAFSAAPMTLPSHISLFSSRPPLETKVTNNGQTVPEDLPLLAEWLAENGYDCRAVLSLGTLDPLHDDETPARGFESYDHDYWDMARAEWTFERLKKSLAERDADEPLFLFAHFADPHEPYDANGAEEHRVLVRLDGAPLADLVVSDMNQWEQTVKLTGGRNVFEFVSPEKPPGRFRVRRFECLEDGDDLELLWEAGTFMERVSLARVVVDRGDRPDAECKLKLWMNDVPVDDDARRRRYASEVAYSDRYVGALLSELERLGLYENSLIVFTSDHGEGMGEHNRFGHAERVTDEQIHVPLIVKLPANDPRGAELAAVAERMVSHLDLVPTLLEIVGLPPLEGQRGLSLFEPHETVHIAEAHRPEAKRTQLALRDSAFKMVYYPAEGDEPERFELFDLHADPGELVDVFAVQHERRADWPQRLRALYEQSQAPAGAGPEIDREAMEEALRALGYGGGSEEEAEGQPEPEGK